MLPAVPGLFGRREVKLIKLGDTVGRGISHPSLVPRTISCVIRETSVVVASIHVNGNAPLFQVAGALNIERPGFGPVERGQQQARENGDDGDHHQQLDQRER